MIGTSPRSRAKSVSAAASPPPALSPPIAMRPWVDPKPISIVVKPFERGVAILHRSRMRSLRGEPVVDRDDNTAYLAHQSFILDLIHLRAAEDIAAAVDLEISRSQV